MTTTDFFIVALLVVAPFLVVRAVYRRLLLNRSERAFLSLAASQGIERARAMDFVNLARAKGTTAMEEATAEAEAMCDNDLRHARQRAGIAVMERAARDEFKRLKQEGDLKSIEEISEAADAAGIAALNQYTEAGGPLADDSPMITNIAALQAFIDNCNDDLDSIPPGEEYVTQVGRVAKKAADAL